MENSSELRIAPGARESSAGDDFHLLWGARKALELLLPNGDFKAMSVEGPEPQDSTVIDPDGDKLLGIDLTEYFGGNNFVSASKVIHSQLKYSTIHPSLPWTSARLCQGKKHGTSGSIIQRLAQIFIAYFQTLTREEILPRLLLKLVSNRPLSSDLSAAMVETQVILRNFPGKIRRADLYHRLSDQSLSEVERLNAAAGLTSYQFTDFLRLLDFSDCGTGSRFEQDAEVVKLLGGYGSPEVRSQYAELKTLIHRRMMPESRNVSPLVADDIVPIFRLSSLREAFPAEAKLEPLKNPVIRLQLRDINKAVMEHSHGPICIHAAAGYGKTTVARLLNRYLPESSIFVLFDCYGGGSYLDPAEIRHSHRRAIMQIANEIAVAIGGPLLCWGDLCPEDLLRSLIRRFKIASDLAKAKCKDALVVIVIDAADNSIAAAKQSNDKSFIQDLARCEMPDGCRLVITSRTHNKDEILLPDTTMYIELNAFDESESNANLARFFPEPSQSELSEFHLLSGGIPRIQAYALQKGDSGIEAVLTALRPGGKTVAGIVNQQIAQSSKKLGDEAKASNICKNLITLPRPVPIAYVAYLSNVDIDTVHDFCIDMFPGLRLDGELISFCDIDFEEHLRQRFIADKIWLEKIADLLFSRADDDPYAAIHLADILYRSGRNADLRNIVLEEKSIEIIIDPLQRRDTFIRRARLALNTSIQEKHKSEYFKLLLIAAEAAKTDQAVRRLIVNNADLASKYGDPRMVQRLYLNEKETNWYGPSHLHCAAIFSRDEKTKNEAKEHFKAAVGWLNWRRSLSRNELENYRISIDDIAAGTEAILRIAGIDDAANWLSRWHPRSIAYKVTGKIASTIILRDGSDAFVKLLDSASLRADIGLSIIEAYVDANLSPPPSLLTRVADVWRRFTSCGFTPSNALYPAGIKLCEALTEKGAEVEDILKLLKIFTPSPPLYRPRFFAGEEEALDIFIRGTVLRAILQNQTNESINVEILYPERLRQTEEVSKSGEIISKKHEIEQERQRFNDIYQPLLPSYEFRAHILLGKTTKENKYQDFLRCLYGLSSNYRIGLMPEASHLVKLIAMALTDASIHADSDPGKWVLKIEQACSENSKAGNIIWQLPLAEKILNQTNLHTNALALISAVQKEIEARPMVASEQIETLIRCARIGDAIDPEIGRAFFEMAIDSASDIDQEAYEQLICLSQLAKTSSRDDNELSNPQLAYDLARFTVECHHRMEGWDNFPWTATLRGVTYLDPASGFAILSRLDDQGVIDIEEGILPILCAAVEKNFLPSTEAYPLTIMARPSDEFFCDVSLFMLNKASQSNNRSVLHHLLDQIVNDISLYTPLDSKEYRAHKILEWVQENEHENQESILLLKQLHSFLLNIKDEETKAQIEKDQKLYRPVERHAEPEVNWDEILKKYKSSDPISLEEVIDDISGSDTYGYDKINTLLENIKKQTHPSQYIEQLESLIIVNKGKLPFYPLLEALKSRFTDWIHHPGVRGWKLDAAKKIVSRRFDEFINSRHFSMYMLSKVAETFEVTERDLLKIVASELPNFLEKMPASALYEVAEGFIHSLSLGGSKEILEWIIPRLSAKIRKGLVDGEWRDELTPPRSSNSVISGFLWSAFGHPDRRVRWKAAHAVRRMVRLGHSEIIGGLSALLNDRQNLTFRAKGYPFYWLSSRLWMFIVIERLAREAPHAIFSLADLIINEALIPEISHALIRYFAKQAALALSKNYPTIYKASQLDNLGRVSVTPYEIIKVDWNKTYSMNSLPTPQKREDLRFSFDSMDTIPYWYKPLGSVFGISGYEVAKVAEYWICDKWGFIGTVWAIDKRHNDRRYDYRLKMHSHGEEPVVEGLETYLEYHAMFCAAEQLLNEKPLIKDWDEGDPWENWLRRWNLTWGDSWLADRRDSTPFQRQFWTMGKVDEKTWKWEITSNDFDRAIGLIDPPYEGFILANGDQTRYHFDDYESIHVSSALVSPKTATALLRALQTSFDFHEYLIPLEGDELEIDEADFELKGWLKRNYAEDSGIDESDPLRNQLDKTVILPGKTFTEWANLNVSADGRLSWYTDHPEKKVTFFEHWNDCPQTFHPYGFRSEGHRFWIDINELLRFLVDQDRCLIMECLIDRHSKRFDEIGGYIPGYGKLYLIYPDGKVEELGKSYQLRQTSHRGTGIN